MSNVISFCDYRQRKLEEQEEKEWNAFDAMIEGALEAGVTFTFSDENGNIIFSTED